MPSLKTVKALEEARKLVAVLEACDDSEASHLVAMKQVNLVRSTLQEPTDIVSRFFEYYSFGGAFNTILSIRAYHAMPTDGSSITADELARITHVAPTVIHRIFRSAINHGCFVETAADTYAHNDLSRALHPLGLGSFLVTALEFSRAWTFLPEYLKSHQPDDIFDLKKSPAVFSVGKESLGLSYYEAIERDPDPERRAIWDASMSLVDRLMPITGMFPFDSLKPAVQAEPDRPFFVDIGAGRGQSCLVVQKIMGSDFQGKYILEDLPGVIKNLKPEDLPGIEFVHYNAFDPQPVKNAHIYFMRRFLHDFYPDVCKTFVKNTASAMGPDSRFIICDMIVPEKTVAFEDSDFYWLDFALLCMTGQEKKKGVFLEILDYAGLELVQIYPSSYGRTVMIEARLKK